MTKMNEIYAFVVYEPDGSQQLFALKQHGCMEMQCAFRDINLAKAIQPIVDEIQREHNKTIVCRKFVLDETFVMV